MRVRPPPRPLSDGVEPIEQIIWRRTCLNVRIQQQKDSSMVSRLVVVKRMLYAFSNRTSNRFGRRSMLSVFRLPADYLQCKMENV